MAIVVTGFLGLLILSASPGDWTIGTGGPRRQRTNGKICAALSQVLDISGIQDCISAAATADDLVGLLEDWSHSDQAIQMHRHRAINLERVGDLLEFELHVHDQAPLRADECSRCSNTGFMGLLGSRHEPLGPHTAAQISQLRTISQLPAA